MAVEDRNIEYRVRPVTRFVVTRYERVSFGGKESGGVDTKGEFDNFDIAYQVGYALCRDEHQRLGWPLGDERIKYPEPPQPPDGAMAADPHLAPALSAK
ncbi:hypothetical protein [Sinorhizobium meliloti]|uniref:hypothetical protein n=1 Tax=Rhizobium meliloti TaxID=382 RepID=UPI001298160F|nr:hypothetical protein [Sinorhizobium meliloti]MQU85683.1 hypothetical protein [Sinorhizobium meliloti]